MYNERETWLVCLLIGLEDKAGNKKTEFLLLYRERKDEVRSEVGAIKLLCALNGRVQDQGIKTREAQ